MRMIPAVLGWSATALVLQATPAPAATPDPLPKQPGRCVTTSIAQIGGRLDGDSTFETGTAVRYADGGVQVSYDKVQALITARVGDPVRVCLVSLPKGCPPGDDRGRIYRTRDLRSGRSWTMPETQHSCGGA